MQVSIYDVFVFSNSGVVTLATGPAWTTPTAGAGARGTGAGTTELTRVAGYLVNAVQITGRNGATTYTISANLATYLGSLFMDGTNGQITCHRAWGQSRKWGIWNAFNRQPIILKAGDSTASWEYETGTIRASNGAAANSMTVFSGLAEEIYEFGFSQYIELTGLGSAVPAASHYGIGFNSTTAMSGKVGKVGSQIPNSGDTDVKHSHPAQYIAAPSLGINVITATETTPVSAGASGVHTFFGGEDDMILLARWRG